MKNTKNMVKDAVDNINKHREEQCEETVTQLVENIVHAESQIKHNQQCIKEDKERLKELQMPEKVAVDL